MVRAGWLAFVCAKIQIRRRGSIQFAAASNQGSNVRSHCVSDADAPSERESESGIYFAGACSSLSREFHALSPPPPPASA